MSNRLPGNVLGLEIDDNFVSCETSCEFTFEQELRGASAFDSGRWKENILGIRSWSISLNAAMLIESAPTDATTILNAFLNGTRMKIRFRTKFAGYGNLMIVGYVQLQSGGISAAVNTSSSWNTTLVGDGQFSLTDTEQLQAFYGYRLADPFGDEVNLVPQFSKFIDSGATFIPFDFTVQSAGNYLFAKVPTGQPIFNVWENNEFNFGEIPDFAWREKNTVAGFDYYISRSPLFITSAVPVITLRLKSTTPNDFTFNPIFDALLEQVYESNTITVTGITEPVPISIVDGEYSINGGAFTNVSGFVPPNAVVKVRLTTGPFYSYANSAILNIGVKSASFDVTTTVAIGNDAITEDFRRNNCPSGQVGSLVSYTLPANTYFSDTKEKANAIANEAFPVLGQNFANDPSNGGTCTLSTFKNFTISQSARRLRIIANDGAIACSIFTTVTYTINSDPFESTRTITLNAGDTSALNNGGSITAALDDVINIISVSYAPEICGTDNININY